MPYEPLVVNNRDLGLPKAIVSPDLGGRTVLTNEPWDFVELELVRRKKSDAQVYWQQAREFYKAAQGLPIQSAPLLLYYAFMNATKALLSSKGIVIDPYHGVTEWKPAAGARQQAFSVGVRIKTNGVLPCLARYYGETEPTRQHTLKDILYNLPFIHRTYCLTYMSQQEMFIPIVKPLFVVETGSNNIFLAAQLSSHFTAKKFTNRIPATLTATANNLLSAGSVAISSVKNPTNADLQALTVFAKSFRNDLFYINGAQTLWYIKATVRGNSRILRQTTTLTLAAMHRLSEVCRYAPMQLVKYLEGQKNWLLSEFIKMSGIQFIDEMASEITGKNVMTPNVRPAN